MDTEEDVGGTLPAPVRLVLAQLELVAQGTIMRYDSSGGDGDSVYPPGGRHAPHIYYRGRYLKCETDDARAEVLDQAREELKHLRGQFVRPRVREETKAELYARIVDAGQGWPLSEVARHFRCGDRDVLNARVGAGRRPDDGTLWPQDQETHAADARRMRAGGMTVRQIATTLGVPRTTVHRWLQKRAA